MKKMMAILAVALMCSVDASAQGFLKKLGEKAKEKVENARQSLAKSLASIEESKKKQEEYPAKIRDAEVKMNTCKELLDKQSRPDPNGKS